MFQRYDFDFAFFNFLGYEELLLAAGICGVRVRGLLKSLALAKVTEELITGPIAQSINGYIIDVIKKLFTLNQGIIAE